MAKVISFANQKGGVGKTTSAVNVAAALGLAGKKTLLVDMDPQGNATTGVGISKKAIRSSMYDVLIHRAAAKDAVLTTEYTNLWVIPCNMTMAAAEFELVDYENREARLKNQLQTLLDDYDYIIIDCPPSLGVLTINCLTASHGVVIPMQCEYYSLEGLAQLMMSIKQVKRLYNPSIEITGILITMYNGRLNLSSQVMKELKRYYADKIFASSVVRNVKLSEAPSYGMPIMYYDKGSKGAVAYTEIAAELMQRI